MPRIWKDALYPGRWRLPDGREFDCQPNDISHYAQRVQEMLAAGLHIPMAWEHQDVGPVPLSDAEALAERTKGTFGHLTGSRVNGDGFLELETEVVDAEDARRLPKVRFVSPEIRYDYIDPTGRKWPGPSITHLAVTPRPIQFRQRSFALSDPAAEPIRLSLAGYKPELSQGDNMAQNLMKKRYRLAEDDNGETTNGNGNGDSETTPPPPPPDSDGNSGQVDEFKETVELLESLGIMLPEDVSEDNFYAMVRAALLTKNANAEEETPPPPPPEENEEEEEATMGMSPLGLSQNQRGKKRVKLSQEAVRLSALEAALTREKRGKIVQRVKRLQGFLDKEQFTALWNDAHKVQLSLSANGELQNNNFLIRLSAYEDMAKAMAKRGGGFFGQEQEEEVDFTNEGFRDVSLSEGNLSESDVQEQKKAGRELASYVNGGPRKR